jgi:hypothetical protein
VGDDPQRDSAGAGLADPVELEERRPPNQPVSPQADQQSYVAFEGDRPGAFPGTDQGPGEVDQQAVATCWTT